MIFLFQRRQTRLCGLCGGGPAGQWLHHALRRLPAVPLGVRQRQGHPPVRRQADQSASKGALHQRSPTAAQRLQLLERKIGRAEPNRIGTGCKPAAIHVQYCLCDSPSLLYSVNPPLVISWLNSLYTARRICLCFSLLSTIVAYQPDSSLSRSELAKCLFLCHHSQLRATPSPQTVHLPADVQRRNNEPRTRLAKNKTYFKERGVPPHWLKFLLDL